MDWLRNLLPYELVIVALLLHGCGFILTMGTIEFHISVRIFAVMGSLLLHWHGFHAWEAIYYLRKRGVPWLG